MPETTSWLVADVGGTNARFALARADDPHLLVADSIRVLRVADFPTPALATRHYLDGLRAEPAGALYAVAGPTDGDTAQLTNHPWSFAASELRAALGDGPVTLVNDFAAIAWALPAFGPDELLPLGGPGLPVRGASRSVHAVVGPGTGLGVAVLLRDGTGERVLETEGGHATYAAETAGELEIARLLGAQFGRVSWERVLCGSGLANLYRACATMAGDAPEAGIAPDEVTRRAGANSDRHCVRAVEVFCALLGAFAGDVALNHGAWDGVFIGGGIPMRLLQWLESGEFRRRFENKGRFAGRFASIPVALIRHPFPGLLGAARRALALAATAAA